jgi:hypothetical protein
MNRRTFLKTAAAGCALVTTRAWSRGEDAPPAGKLVLSAPLTHSDWMLKPGIAWGAEGVRHMLDACKACGWSRVHWRVLDGGRSLYASKLMDPGGPWDEDSFWSPQTPADKALAERYTAGLTPEKRKELLDKFSALDYAHFDTLAEAVRYGHSIGLQIHAWVSINEDDHGWGLRSRFSKQHPEFRWVKRSGQPYHSQLSFAFPEVRAYKLAIVEELLRGYPIDGLFLDWIRTGDVRDNPQNDKDGVADFGYEAPLVDEFKRRHGADPREVPNGDERWVRVRAEPQTQFMRDVRARVASVRPVPVSVLVGHPWHYRGEVDRIAGNLNGLLLDTGTWGREGLMDAAVAAGYYRDGGTPGQAYEALKKEVGPAVDVWSYAWVPASPEQFEQDVAVARKAGAKQVLLWEADYIDDRANRDVVQAAMRGVAAQ